MRRFIAILLAAFVLVMSLPLELAAAPGDVDLKTVQITKTYRREGGSAVLDKVVLNATGDNLDKATFRLEKKDGSTQIIDLKPKPGSTFAETVLSGEDVKNLVGNTLKISGQGMAEISYDLTTNLPRFEYPTKPFKKTDEVVLTGSNYLKVKNGITEGIFFKSDSNVPILPASVKSDTEIKQHIGNNIQGSVGVSFKNKATVGTVKITSEHRYPDSVTVIADLKVSNVRFFPNRGPVQTKVTLAGKLMDEKSISIFFIPKTADIYNFSAYNLKNMVKPSDEQYSPNYQGTGEDRFFIKVPQGIDPGHYNVVLTNEVTNKPSEQINSLFLVETEYVAPIGDSPADFYVTNTPFAEIVNMDPLEGAAGTNVKIDGINLGSLSDQEFKPTKGYDITISEEPIPPNSPAPKLTLVYTPKSGGTLGKYDYFGVSKDIKSIKREITGDIGEPVSFISGSTFTQALDTLQIRLPSPHQGDPWADVNIYTKTRIEFMDGTFLTPEDTAVINPKNANWKKTNGKYQFHYLETLFTPEIKDGGIFPDKLPVDDSNTLLANLEVYITGKNFVKYRYRDQNGVEKIKYPLVDLGSQFIVNKNLEGAPPAHTWKDSFIEVYNKGRVVSGNQGDQEGDTIKITIPQGVSVDPNQINNPSTVATVKNPIKNADPIIDNDQNFFGNAQHRITFIRVSGNERPEITEIQPSPIVPANEVTKDLKAIGKNFDLDCELYIEGKKVNDAKRDPVNNIITFSAPAKPVGNYQVAVINPRNGAVGIFNYLTYIQTSTEGLSITNYQPHSGKKDDLINVTGTSFVLPDPTVSDINGSGVWRLIGSIIKLDDKDINEYTSKDAQGNPKASIFAPAESLVKIEGNSVRATEEAAGVFLEKGGKYFILRTNYTTGETVITDGQSETYKVTTSSGFSQSGSTLTNDGKTFNIMTVYKNEGGKLTGHRVFVKSNYELTFRVPSPPEFQPRLDNPYDLTVQNPDTRKATVADGFTILAPIVNPEITSVNPNIVSEEGGIPILIKGKDFINLGEDKKSVVYVDGVKVPADKTTVGLNNDEIKIIVPKYVPKGGAKSLAEEIKTDRKQVPIVVQNPGGGSARWEDFYYMVLKNRPVIDAIQPKTNEKGTKEVDIFGNGFIFYEPFTNNKGGDDSKWEPGESFSDLNGNGKWDSYKSSSDPDFIKELTDLATELGTHPENEGKSQEELKKLAWDKYVKPILPKVYFRPSTGTDAVEAEIVAFSPTQITVKLPELPSGKAVVYLINNNYASSNEVEFEFVSSGIKITEVAPQRADKKGGKEVNIIGGPFLETTISVIDGNMTKQSVKMPLVRFGDLSDKNMSNRSTSIDEPNSGKVTGTRGMVEVGGLTVSYDSSSSPKMSFSYKANGKVYSGEIPYNMSEGAVYLPLSSLKDPDGNFFQSNEMVRIEIKRDQGSASSYRIFVDRGYARTARLTNTGIFATTPEFYKTGKTKVTVYNNDKDENEKADHDFEFTNPGSHPRITNILKDEKEGSSGRNSDGKLIKIITVSPNGGNKIRVIGEDFRNPSVIKFVGNEAKVSDIHYEKPGNNSNYSELTFTMPALGEKAIGKLIPLTVSSSDNDASSVDADPPIYFRVAATESPDLKIISVTPNKGPTTGGTEIEIKGADFRREMEGFSDKFTVYFERNGEVKAVTDFLSFTHDTIKLKTPPFSKGPVKIRVQNPDGNIASLDNAFTYEEPIVPPRITKIVYQEDPKKKLEVLSDEGDEKVTIVGTGFQEGAKVLFGPILTEITKDNKPDEKAITLTVNGKKYFIKDKDYYEAKDVKVIDSEHINVTTPKGEKGRSGVLVINKDGGISNLYPIKYDEPKIETPTQVAALLGFDGSIKLTWTGAINSEEYEIFASENAGPWQFLASTRETFYVWHNPKPNTTYKFMVRNKAKRGTSDPIKVSESNIIHTGSDAGYKDKDGKLLDKTAMKKSGINGSVLIGNDFSSDGLTLDLTKGDLSGVKNLTLRIPSKIIREGLGDVKIKANDYSLTFNPKIFRNDELMAADESDQDGVVFNVAPYKKTDLSKYTINKMSEPLSVSAEMTIGKQKTKVAELAEPFNLKMDYSELSKNTKRYKWVLLAKYDDKKKMFLKEEDFKTLGVYMLIGGRK